MTTETTETAAQAPGSQPEGAVVVGVPADGCDAALRYAAAECARTGRPLHLVRVVAMAVSGMIPQTADEAVLDVARHVLDRAIADAQQHLRDVGAGGVGVTGELVDTGFALDDLVHRSPVSHLVVLQHRRLGPFRRVVSRSMTCSVAGRAAGPVLSVPETWRADAPEHGLVTVAVQHPEASQALVRLACDRARERGAAVRVLHSWWLGDGHDGLVGDDPRRAQQTAHVRQELEDAVTAAGASDLTVHVEVRHHPPVDSVLEAAAVSDLVVTGRRDRRLPVGSHLGHVARSAIDHADCPVLVAPESAG